MKLAHLYLVTNPQAGATKYSVSVVNVSDLPGVIASTGAAQWKSAALYTDAGPAFVDAIDRWKAARMPTIPAAVCKAHVLALGGGWSFAILEAYDRANGHTLRRVSAIVGAAIPKSFPPPRRP